MHQSLFLLITEVIDPDSALLVFQIPVLPYPTINRVNKSGSPGTPPPPLDHCYGELKIMEFFLYLSKSLVNAKMFWQIFLIQFSSVQFSRSVMSDSLRPHELQHARPPCPSPAPGVHSDSRPSSR